MTLLAGFALNWIYRTWELDPQATFGTTTAFIPEPVKIGGAVLLVALLVLSMWRTHLPPEWMTLRDKLATFTGVLVTGRGLRAATVAALALLYVSTGLFTVQPGELGIRSRFGEITNEALSPGLHYRLPWPVESHRVVGRDVVRRVELGFRSAEAAGLAERALARKRLTVGGPSNPVPNAIQSTVTRAAPGGPGRRSASGRPPLSCLSQRSGSRGAGDPDGAVAV